jgi:hypothetical protein
MGEFSRARFSRAPYYPSQVLEAWVGFDVECALTSALSMFMQFKVSCWMRNRTSEEYPTIQKQYFRFDILRRQIDATTKTSSQHNLLKYLSEQQYGPVYYVAPLFYSYTDYEKVTTCGNTLANTIFLDFERDGLRYISDDELHRVAFLPDASAAWQCSQPTSIGPGRRGNSILKEIEKYAGQRRDHLQGKLQLQRRSEELGKLKTSLIAGVREYVDTEPTLRGTPDQAYELNAFLQREFGQYWGENQPDEQTLAVKTIGLALDIDELSRRYYGSFWYPY